MQKRDSVHPLVEAAEAFAEELRSYASLSEAFHRAPLVSAKHLERVNETLSQIAACEQRLADSGRGLAAAVGAARDEQERLAKATLERIPALKERTEQLGQLLLRFDELGKEATALNEVAASLARGHAPGETNGSPTERARALAASMLALATRAEEIVQQARDADFEELGRRAHALHQQLLSAHHKLQLATVG